MEHQNPLPSGFCFQKLLGRKLTSLFFELKNHFLGHGEEGTWAEAEKKAEEREEIASTALMAEFQVGIGQEASRITCHCCRFHTGVRAREGLISSKHHFHKTSPRPTQ